MAMTKATPAVKPRSQPTKASCWLSCLEMMFEWKKDKNGDKTKDPDKILATLDASPNLKPYMMRDFYGIAMSECREVATLLGMKCAGGGTFDATEMDKFITAHGPFWCAGDWGSGSHVIVVTAISPDDGKIRYINPYANNGLTDSAGTLSWLNNRTDAWKSCGSSVLYWQ